MLKELILNWNRGRLLTGGMGPGVGLTSQRPRRPNVDNCFKLKHSMQRRGRIQGVVAVYLGTPPSLRALMLPPAPHTHLHSPSRTTTPDRVLPPALPDGWYSSAIHPVPAVPCPYLRTAQSHQEPAGQLLPEASQRLRTLFSADSPQPHLLRAPASLAHPGFPAQACPPRPALPTARPHPPPATFSFLQASPVQGKFPLPPCPSDPYTHLYIKSHSEKSPLTPLPQSPRLGEAPLFALESLPRCDQPSRARFTGRTA